MLTAVAKNWWVLLLRGICAVVFGIMAIAWPGETLQVLILLFGAYVLVDGMFALTMGFRGKLKGGIWWQMVLVGLLSLLAGIMTFAWPGLTAVALLVLVASWAIVRGFTEIVAAFALRKTIDDEWVLALSGVISIIFGALMLIHPAAGALAIVLLIGAFMLAVGFMMIALSMRLRRLHQVGADVASQILPHSGVVSS
jgi:uncharacterized membrane protein HdeD (DUF308 family)